ncbi:aspartyl-phosphate phosphatase Spo0E family protein [Oceanobacillus saliphilus]|uniref:aspartyl-phosphate phosphatase Spo0E family protein n=1 Tax=Oceanobacillus saliphilus TaxID=2925834 RepID=UPI00201E4193|nr:aspartyl-phosphate phosphatase Spo0E family protein [Oceanobacillus saliphilus]
MAPRKSLEVQVEQLRNKMYEAYKNNESYDRIIKISQELDRLLNRLETPRESK